jgi:lambda family phage portal protein
MPEVPALLDRHGQPLRRAVESRVRSRASLSGSDASSIFPYDAASWYAKETAGWNPSTYSPDYEINYYRDRVVGRSRDLVRNDGWAEGAITRILDTTIGNHFRLVAMPDYRALSLTNKAFDEKWAAEFRHAAEAYWRIWSNDPNRYCDAAEQLSFTQAMRLALRHKLVDGEDLIVMEWLPDRIGRGMAQFATAFHLVDPDRLSNPREMIDQKYFRGGVEIDARGAPIAYHIRRAHQYDWYSAVESMQWDRVERQTEWGRPVVIHDYDRQRADQHRGMPILASVLPRLKMLTRYDAAELQAAALNAILSYVIKSPMDPEGLKATLDDGDVRDAPWYWQTRKGYNSSNPIVMDDVRILNLFPGEDASQLSQQRPGEHHDPFTNYVLRHVAAGIGTTAEELTKDLSKVNYSSIRAGLIEARKTVLRRRTDFAENTAAAVYGCFVEELMDDGYLADVMPKNGEVPDFIDARASYARARWIGPGAGWVDPVKERQGAVLGMDAGFSTLLAECAEQGHDWEEVLDQRAIEVQRFKDKGLKLPHWAGEDQDARQTATKPQPE